MSEQDARLMDKKLETHKRRGSLVTIKRKIIDDYNLHGFILDFSKRLVLLAREDDFFMDGWLAIDRRFITDLGLNQGSPYCKKILEQEKALADIRPGFSVDITDYTSLFRSLKKAHVFVIVEDERPQDDQFLIGPITRINRGSVSIRYFNACGKWEKGYRRIDFDTITLVQFGCNYVRLHQKYIEKRPTSTVRKKKRSSRRSL